MKPALTAEEWASFPNWPLAELPSNDDLPLYYPSKHGIAAANLHGQPFGFTREDVRVLRQEAGYYHDGIADLADRIEALLPPEDYGQSIMEQEMDNAVARNKRARKILDNFEK